MRWPSILLLVAGLPVVCLADEDYEDSGDEDFQGEAVADDEDDAGRTQREDSFQNPSAVFVMEHGWIKDETQEWFPRGTLLLSSEAGQGFEARLSDAKEFVQLKTELPSLMSEAASKDRYYTLRMYSPENPKRTLQTAIPAKLLADRFEDWHDVMEVNMGASGLPLSLSFRVRPSLGLALFEHTQVHISESDVSEGPRVPTKKPAVTGSSPAAAGKEVGPDGEEVDNRSFLRKYWWVILIVMLLVSNLTDDGSGGKGGGGGKRAS